MFDIGAIALLPALPAALIDQNPLEFVAATLGALSGIGVIYVVIGFGLFEIGSWAFERLWQQLVHLVELVARTLPLLVIGGTAFTPFDHGSAQTSASVMLRTGQ